MGGNFKDGAKSNFITSSMAFLYDKVVGDPIDTKPGEDAYYKDKYNPKSIPGANNSGYVHYAPEDKPYLIGTLVPQEVIDKHPWHEGGSKSKWVNDDLFLGSAISRFHDDIFKPIGLIKQNNFTNIVTMPITTAIVGFGYLDYYNYITPMIVDYAN
jgi:hypothetical protein